MGNPPPWYEGLINYYFGFYKCGNSSWSANPNAFCYENAAIRIALYGQSSSWISNLSSCQFKETENSTPQNIDNGIGYGMNLYLATSRQNSYDMVAKFPEGVDPSNSSSLSQMTLFQYGNFNITPGVADPNSSFVQLPNGPVGQSQNPNILVIYHVNDIHLENGALRFNKTPIKAYGIDEYGEYSDHAIPNDA